MFYLMSTSSVAAVGTATVVLIYRGDGAQGSQQTLLK
jgi:hypothetical protein